MRFASLIFWHYLKVKLNLLFFVFFAVVAKVDLLETLESRKVVVQT
jgi:hypothetical protein